MNLHRQVTSLRLQIASRKLSRKKYTHLEHQLFLVVGRILKMKSRTKKRCNDAPLLEYAEV